MQLFDIQDVGKSEKDIMSLCCELKELIDSHLDKHPNVSINALASKSKVGASTLRRIVNGTLKGDPSPHTVLNLVSTIKKKKCLNSLINSSEGHIGKTLTECFGQYVDKSSAHQLDLDLDAMLGDSISYFIYKLAANKSGVSIFTISQMYGALGIEKLNILVDAGHITKEGQMLHAKQKDYCTTVETALMHLPELIRLFKLDEVEYGRNLFYTQSESLNMDGIRVVKKIQKEAVLKIQEVLNHKSYAGDIPYFTITMSDTLEVSQTNKVLQ